MTNRIIFHGDMDAFFASVEELDKPWLKNQPLVVAGSSKRGIITTANYEARKYGLHSAMPMFIAKKLCPHVVVVPVRKKVYSQYSKRVQAILSTYTEKLEMLSLDEAYLDMSHIQENPILVAKDIQETIWQQTNLTLSLGISYNKFLAKIASDMKKPRGLTQISKDQVPDILLDLPISNVHGIGNIAMEKFQEIGIYRVEDLMELSEDFLLTFLGSHGTELYHRIRGIDYREVEPYRNRKSLGTEKTFSEDIETLDELKSIMVLFIEELYNEIEKKGIQAKTITVKLRNSLFNTRTRSYSFANYMTDKNLITKKSLYLLETLFKEDSYRLMGLSLSNLIKDDKRQISFFD